MGQHVAFLRGVNVNGINIRMAELKAAFEALGFTGVKTVLASGNVRFEGGREEAGALKREIEAQLARTFGYQAWIVLLPLDAVRNILEACPFERGRAGWHAYAVLASDPSVLADLAGFQDALDPATERLQAGTGVLYWEVLKGMTVDSTFGKELARAKYRASTTSRNLNTLEKLL